MKSPDHKHRRIPEKPPGHLRHRRGRQTQALRQRLPRVRRDPRPGEGPERQGARRADHVHGLAAQDDRRRHRAAQGGRGLPSGATQAHGLRRRPYLDHRGERDRRTQGSPALGAPWGQQEDDRGDRRRDRGRQVRESGRREGRARGSARTRRESVLPPARGDQTGRLGGSC
ncbi:MAG: hypothetical protein MZU84_08930 [Sphingobacterium sp.]|nr:hypothetical protein [Sphingobacterium sp.]